MSAKPTILVVDDVPLNIDIMREYLHDDHRILVAKNGMDALSVAERERPDMILLDIIMPGMSGIETCKRLKENPFTQKIPVIFVTTKEDPFDEEEGFKVGGVDYIHKPASLHVIRARVKTHLNLSNQQLYLEHLVAERTREVEEVRHEVVRRLSIASEFRDSETGMHTKRIGLYAEVLARAYDLTHALCSLYEDAAALHDIGKIGISDTILLKTGKLTVDEMEIIKTHTTIGANILEGLPQELFRLSAASALTHHEKWDGSGYPAGLAGRDIPLIGRIVAVCDVFDALISERPYKRPWPHPEAVEKLKEGRGTHFDPEILDLFIFNMDKMTEISAIK